MPKRAAQLEREIAEWVERHRPKHVRVTIRPKIYRDVKGFGITGRDFFGRSFSIFTRTRAGAEAIKLLYQTRQDPGDAVDTILLRGG